MINISEPDTRYSLVNDPSCGLTTGGREECWWSCEVRRVEEPFAPGIYYPLIPEPSCLSDCYPADHCLSSLLADYHSAGGICQGSRMDVIYPGLFPVSNKSCELYEAEDFYFDFEVKRGLCSERTQELLTTDQLDCIRPLWNQKLSIFWTADFLIESLCGQQTWWDFYPAPIDRRRVKIKRHRNRRKKVDKRKKRREHKFNCRNETRKYKVKGRFHFKKLKRYICISF